MADVFSAPGGAIHCNPIAKELLTTSVLPNCTWRAGQAAAMARSSAVRLMGALVKAHAVKETYQSLLQHGLIPLLLTALEEEEAGTRLIACGSLTAILNLVLGDVGYEDTKRALPEVLKRLDDSRDLVRIACLETVDAMVNVVTAQNSWTYYDYIIEGVLNYLEDSDPSMRDNAYTYLEKWAKLDAQKFIKCVHNFRSRGVTTAEEPCQRLLAFAGAL